MCQTLICQWAVFWNVLVCCIRICVVSYYILTLTFTELASSPGFRLPCNDSYRYASRSVPTSSIRVGVNFCTWFSALGHFDMDSYMVSIVVCVVTKIRPSWICKLWLSTFISSWYSVHVLEDLQSKRALKRFWQKQSVLQLQYWYPCSLALPACSYSDRLEVHFLMESTLLTPLHARWRHIATYNNV